MDMNIKIGVVIPIYNVEQYLVECLESVLNQSYTNLSVLLVNDGSSDGSRRVSLEYVRKDSRFILIDKVNEGVSSARNVGIDFYSKKYEFIESKEYENSSLLTYKIISSNPYDIKYIYAKDSINNAADNGGGGGNMTQI